MLQAMIFLQDTPSQTILDIWQNLKCAYVSINATQLAQFLWVLFKGYPDIFEHYSRAYSRIFRTLCISGIFLSPSIFGLPRYIHNTTLNIFTKASSSTFDIVLNTPVSYRCYLTSGVTLRYTQGYSGMFKIYLGLFIYPGLFRRYFSGIFSHIHDVRHIQAYLATFGYILDDSGIQNLGTATRIHVY